MYYVDHNPFPGVNPFIEAERYWEDFHRTFIPTMREMVLHVLPAPYDIRIDQEIVFREPSHASRTGKPDVAIIDRPGTRAASVATLDRPAAVEVEIEMEQVEEERRMWAEVRRLSDDELITSIELLSPTNKTGEGATIFREKRLQLIESGVNLVDLDLLRGGQRLRFAEPLPPGDFYAFVARRRRLPKVSVVAWTLRDPLPWIAIPLADSEPDVRLDLSAVYRATFDRGGYPRRLRYREPLPLYDDATNAWATSLAAAAAS